MTLVLTIVVLAVSMATLVMWWASRPRKEARPPMVLPISYGPRKPSRQVKRPVAPRKETSGAAYAPPSHVTYTQTSTSLAEVMAWQGMVTADSSTPATCPEPVPSTPCSDYTSSSDFGGGGGCDGGGGSCGE